VLPPGHPGQACVGQGACAGGPFACRRCDAYHRGILPRNRPMTLRHALLPICLRVALPALAQWRGFDWRDLLKLDRVSSPVRSPDGHVVVFAQRSVDAELKASTARYARHLLTRDAAPPKRITPEGWNVNSPSFSADGQTLYFLSAKGGSQQLY